MQMPENETMYIMLIIGIIIFLLFSSSIGAGIYLNPISTTSPSTQLPSNTPLTNTPLSTMPSNTLSTSTSTNPAPTNISSSTSSPNTSSPNTSPSVNPPRTYQSYPNTDFVSQGDIQSINGTVQACQTACDNTMNCTGFSYNNSTNTGYLKNIGPSNTSTYSTTNTYYYTGNSAGNGQAQSPPKTSATPRNYLVNINTDFPGQGNLQNLTNVSVNACQTACDNLANCDGFSYDTVNLNCSLKNITPSNTPSNATGISYYYIPGGDGPTHRSYTLNTNTDFANQGTITNLTNATISKCQVACDSNASCNGFTYDNIHYNCSLKNIGPTNVSNVAPNISYYFVPGGNGNLHRTYNSYPNTDFPGQGDLQGITGTVTGCETACDNLVNCSGFSYINGNCYLKNITPTNVSSFSPGMTHYYTGPSAGNGQGRRIYNSYPNTDFPGQGDIQSANGNLQACETTCDNLTNCNGFSYDGINTCYLKNITSSGVSAVNPKLTYYYTGPSAGNGAAH